jgi:hypothetical protein
MKLKKLLLFVQLFLLSELVAQTPNLISYQAVIRNSSNVLIANKQVGMKISILKGGIMGTPVFIELHSPTTNSNGLISIEIGNGTNIQGSISQIEWANDLYFLQTDIDPTGGVNYSITGTSQFLTVPYAFHSRTADSVLNYPSLKIIKTADSIIFSNGYSFSLGDEDSENELQKLVLVNDSIKLSKNGGAITLNDNDALNEIQKLEYSRDTLRLSKNEGFIILNDDDSTNEIQTLKLSGDTLLISKSNYVLINQINSKKESPFSINDKVGAVETTDVYLSYGLTKRNAAWTANAIYPLAAAWEPYSNTNSPYRMTWDVFFERNDSVFFFENGQGVDVISSYFFDKSEVNFGGPTFDVLIKSGLAKEEITRFQTLGVNAKHGFFYWMNNSGLCIYNPFTNNLTTTLDLHPASKNINWLTSLIPTSSSLVCLHMVDSNLFVMLKETNNNISFYKYNYFTDTKMKIWDTKISTTTFGIPNNNYIQIAFTTRGNGLFNDSIFIIPFNGADNQGVLINNELEFGYLIFDYLKKNVDTFYTDLNRPILYGMPRNKSAFVTIDNVFIDVKSKKILKLNLLSNKNWMEVPVKQYKQFPFMDKLYWINTENIQKGGSCRTNISCYPHEFNYPYFYLKYK